MFCSIKVLSYEKSDRWCWERDPIVNLVELSNLDDQELQARIATSTDAGERQLLQQVLAKRALLATPPPKSAKDQAFEVALNHFKNLTLRQKFTLLLSSLLMILPFILLRYYVHQHDSYLPSMAWFAVYSLFCVVAVFTVQAKWGMVIWLTLLFGNSAGLPRWTGQQLHEFIATPATMQVEVSAVNESPLAPRCRGYLEFDKPNHLAGWFCQRTDLKSWQKGETKTLAVQQSWFGISVAL